MVDNSQIYLGNKNLPSENASFEYDPQRIREIARCSKDIMHFAESYFYIVTLGEGKKKIELYKPQKRLLRALVKNRFVVCTASRQVGKALALDTPILTNNGWSTMGGLNSNDKVYDEKGNLCNITHLHDILYNRKCYEVVFDNGEKIVADAEHLWSTQTKSERKSNKISVKTTQQIKDTLLRGSKNEPNHRIHIANELKGNKTNLPIDPYLLGVWLGDGTTASAQITIGHQDYEEMMSYLNLKHFSVRNGNGSYSVNIKGENMKRGTDCLRKQLRNLNVLNNKHIPDSYLFSSYDNRLELLKGLIDTDGYISKNGLCHYYTILPVLAKNAVYLISSLGIKPNLRERRAKCNGKDCGICYEINFKSHLNVAKLKRKSERIKISKGRSLYHYIKEINEVESVPVRCISVDSPNNMYLAGNSLIPTHNSTITTIYALWYACFNKDKRIMIVANKEDTAILMLRKIQMAYEQLPNWLKPGVKQWGKTEVIFANDSSIVISTTTASAGRGDTVNCLIIDEAAHIAEHLISEFWSAVIPIVSSYEGTKIFVVSTPNGTSNKFHEIYTRSERGELPEWAYERIDWWEIPGRGKKWKESMLEAMGNDNVMFQQEFENAFLETGQSAIDAEILKNFRSIVTEPIMTLEDGHYKIWEAPVVNHIYVIGVDVGEGVGQAASVAQILDLTDLTNIKLVATYHHNTQDPFHFAELLRKIADQWGQPYLLIERNNCGGQVIDALNEVHNYPNIIDYTPEKQKYYNRLGIYSHSNAKYKGVMNMRYWVNSLRVVSIYDIFLVHELETFIKYPNGTWKKKGGDYIYDDRVMSLVWGLFALEPEIVERYFEVADHDSRGKPLKLNSLNTVDSKYFKLDPYYQSNDAPMPAVLGNDYQQGPGSMEDLISKGWRKMG